MAAPASSSSSPAGILASTDAAATGSSSGGATTQHHAGSPTPTPCAACLCELLVLAQLLRVKVLVPLALLLAAGQHGGGGHAGQQDHVARQGAAEQASMAHQQRLRCQASCHGPGPPAAAACLWSSSTLRFCPRVRPPSPGSAGSGGHTVSCAEQQQMVPRRHSRWGRHSRQRTHAAFAPARRHSRCLPRPAGPALQHLVLRSFAPCQLTRLKLSGATHSSMRRLTAQHRGTGRALLAARRCSSPSSGCPAAQLLQACSSGCSQLHEASRQQQHNANVSMPEGSRRHGPSCGSTHTCGSAHSTRTRRRCRPPCAAR